MRTRLKKQQQHDVVTGTPVQAKLLADVRPMDNTFYSPQTSQTEDQQSQQTQQDFNFAQMPIFASEAAAPRVQAKFFPGMDKVKQQSVQAKLEPVQREEGEEEMQAKLEPVQREEGEEEMQAKLEPVQREEGEEEMQAKLEPVQREEGEEEMQAKLEPVQRQESKRVSLAPTSIGKPMPKAVQRKMEGAFGTDFSGVRIHEGPQAKSINAIAYTQGSDIHFQPGKYQPNTQSGQELLGHELTHVVQQRARRVAAPQRKGIPLNTDTNLETEADVLGAKAARGEHVQVAGQGTKSQVQTATSALLIQRMSIAMSEHQDTMANQFGTKNYPYFESIPSLKGHTELKFSGHAGGGEFGGGGERGKEKYYKGTEFADALIAKNMEKKANITLLGCDTNDFAYDLKTALRKEKYKNNVKYLPHLIERSKLPKGTQIYSFLWTGKTKEGNYDVYARITTTNKDLETDIIEQITTLKDQYGTVYPEFFSELQEDWDEAQKFPPKAAEGIMDKYLKIKAPDFYERPRLRIEAGYLNNLIEQTKKVERKKMQKNTLKK